MILPKKNLAINQPEPGLQELKRIENMGRSKTFYLDSKGIWAMVVVTELSNHRCDFPPMLDLRYGMGERVERLLNRAGRLLPSKKKISRSESPPISTVFPARAGFFFPSCFKICAVARLMD